MKLKTWFLPLLIISFNGLAQVPLELLTTYPFPSEPAVAKTGSRYAVAINEKGVRNIYAGESPAFQLKKITNYTADDGQELTSLSISPDGNTIIYVRGGDHGAFDETIPRNPMSLPVAQKIQLMAVPFAGGKPVLLDEGDSPAISPDGKRVAYIKNDAVWLVAADGSAPPKKMFYVRGASHSISWSPDGKQLLFVAARRDHAFIGIYTDSLTPIRYLAPAIARDGSPRWSPDGKQVVFVRRDATGGKPDSLTALRHAPWAIWLADAATGAARPLWQAPATLRGSVPVTQGGFNLHWAAGNHIIFASYEDGWPHLYSMVPGARPLLLTPGRFMLEQISLSVDGQWLLASANTGPEASDLHRRHLVKISIEKPGVQVLTPGTGIETYPMQTGDGKQIVFFSATPQRPTAIAAMPFDAGAFTLAGEQLIPSAFPAADLVTPRAVQFKAADGQPVYGQLFEGRGDAAKKPAIVFVHGGPQRQMLLGWHYGDYYANSYALNQHLASLGFTILSVNYRLGIGYGYEFQNPPHAWIYGAAEYRDVKAAGLWLAAQPSVDASRIGIYGGSYGGYLTALALARDSKLFKAGVDIHGEHNLSKFIVDYKGEAPPDLALAKSLIWSSSPIASLNTWRSPVLLIHGDDDGNVEFGQTVDLAKRFDQKGFVYESLVIPDETHHWMKYSNVLAVDKAVADFFMRKLK